MNEPIPVLVKRYKCPHCSRSRSREQATREHIARCWMNPDNRTCKTCIFYLPAESGRCYGDPQCDCPDIPAACEAGMQLPDPVPGSRELEFLVGCPTWQTRDQDIEDALPAQRAAIEGATR